ncbi:dihydrodipicolinate synthase family protein [Arthrobacter roseus]|uniref:dihydrodipicolinate synthase family protein n=1 Tax=Arthrobacter roseus TaxID=136274 RepID=UPI0019631083|nr:dihydrodipicolinate synthase family protein [Arthrobacter roseus]MBM7848496.1 4-hydroxy-tetrahydrodipicolinate synthase [Arthrobacter roseus]
MDFSGVIAYPVTPFTPDGDINEVELKRLIESLAVTGVDSIVVLGSSGSFAYLNRVERESIIRASVDAAFLVAPMLPVYAGVSAVGTREVLDHASDAERAGAKGLVLSTASYVPLTAEEVAMQCRTVAQSTTLPICLYNNPGTTQFDFPVELVVELAALDNVVALKDPGADGVVFRQRGETLKRMIGENFCHGMSGDAAIVENGDPEIAWHAGAAALLPRMFVELRSSLIEGRAQDAADARSKLQPVLRHLTEQRKLSGLHSLARACGWDAGDPRLPLLPVPGSQHRDMARLVDQLV